MRLGGLLGQEAKERAEEFAAKRELEKKLGRKVTTEELYSLGSHLDAAGDIDMSKPMISTPREASVPFGDAKPPMKLSTKLLLIGIPLLLLTMCFGGTVLTSMSQHTFNRLNPFSPKPPEGTFPAKLGNYTLDHKPDYNEPTSYAPVKNFSAEYKNGTETVRYTLYIYNNEAELNEAFDKRRNIKVTSDKSKVADNSENRYAIAALSGWNNYIYFKDGLYLKVIDTFRQNVGLEFEGLLKNAEPLPAVALNESELKTSSDNTSLSVTATQLLDDYKKDSAAADKKYKGKMIDIHGKVAVSERSKSGTWLVSLMRPGATSPTSGMVVCSFEKSQEAGAMTIKVGDTVHLKGSVINSIVGNVVFERCAKL